MKVPITVTVNGEVHHLEVKPNRTLVDVLREDLGAHQPGSGWV